MREFSGNTRIRLFMIIAVIVIGCAVPAGAQVVFVCDAGDGSAPTSGETATAYPTIGAAIAALTPADGFDTVVVYAPVRNAAYSENLALTTGLTLISFGEYSSAAGEREPVIAAGSGAIIQGADSAILCGFQLDGRAKETGHWGVNLAGTWNMTVRKMTVRNCQYGFHLNSSGNNLLTDNIAETNDCGFVISSSLVNRLEGNRSADNAWYGFVLTMSNGNTLTDNSGERNGRHGFWLVMADRNILTGNRSSANTGDGYYLNTLRNNQLTGNTAEMNSGYGFYLTGANQGGNYSGNTIIPGETASPKGVFCDQANAAFAFTDCYWSTTDESTIAAMIQGPGAASIVWRPHRPIR